MQEPFFSQKVTRFAAMFLWAAAMVVLAGCSDTTGKIASSSTPASSVPPVATLLEMSASPTTVKSDNSNTSSITVTAVDKGNAVVPNVIVNISADSGILSAGSVTTGATGTGTLTFSSGSASKNNRTATITATAGSVTTQIPVRIVNSTVTVSPSTGTLPDDGTSPVTLTILALDAGGNAVPNVAVTLSKSGTGNVTLTPLSGTTDQNGQFFATVAGAAGGAGTATVTAAALGATATSTLTVSPTLATFAIDKQTLNGTVIANDTMTAINIGDSLAVEVNAPSVTSVIFATTIGVWNATAPVMTIPVVSGKATATLTTTGAGVANIQVYPSNSPTTTDSLTVTMTASPATAYSITLQASPSVVPKSSGTTTGYSTLTASVKDVNGYPVGGAPVAFNIINPTGGGESVSPVVVFSAKTTSTGVSLGDAPTTFTAGSLSSGQGGVQVRASVVGTSVATEATGVNLTASGNDAAVVVGGTAGSVTFGQAVNLKENPTLTDYILPMSVIVADSNGNPAPLGTAVNLSVWPIAWSTGVGCVYDSGAVGSLTQTGFGDTATTGTFLNEDTNENVVLDPGEDGVRTYYDIKPTTSVVGGKTDNQLTPPNSAAGTIPGTVYTDANGVATFDLEYTKTNALWIVDRIRGRTIVQGTEAVGEVSFRLDALDKDAGTGGCHLPPSPFIF